MKRPRRDQLPKEDLLTFDVTVRCGKTVRTFRVQATSSATASEKGRQRAGIEEMGYWPNLEVEACVPVRKADVS